MSTGNWTVAEATARFSELVDQTRSCGPQTITENGQTAAVVVSAEEWEQKARRPSSLAEFFAESPVRNSELLTSRKKDRPREAEL